MSAEALAIALNHSRARTATARLVLVGIANHDGDGGSWPAVATLARYAGVTPRNVQKALAHLQEIGEIEVERQGGGLRAMPDHRRPNRYTLTIKCPPTCDGTKNHRVVEPAKTTGVARDTPTPPTGVARDRGGVSSPTPEPSINHSSNNSDAYVGERARVREAVASSAAPAEAVDDRWALECPANYRQGRYLEHTAGRHGRCTLCGARMVGDGSFVALGATEGSRPREAVVDATLDGIAS